MIQRMNLSLSNRCSAKCIFCPQDRGRGGVDNMPLATAARCIMEAKRLGITQFSVSENGDALCNPRFMDIMRLLHAEIPESGVALFSNFALMTADVIDALLAGNLVGNVYCNVDGIETYKAVKGRELYWTRYNLDYFLRARSDRPIPLHVQVLAAPRYSYAMRQMFGKLPEGIPDGLPDETDQVIAEWTPRLRDGDTILASPTIGWAHRDLCSGDPARFACPNLERIKAEAWIAPSGAWYVCCLDSGQQVTFGNIMTQPLDQIDACEERRRIIAALEARDYAAIGYPCTTVQACQTVMP